MSFLMSNIMTSHRNDSTLKGVIKPHCSNFFYRLDAAERSDRRKIGGGSCDDEFQAALDDPAPGIFDQSSWTKWNQRYGRTPIPMLPKRRIPGVDPATVPDFFPAKS